MPPGHSMAERPEELFPIALNPASRTEMRELRAAGVTTCVIGLPWSLIEGHEAQARVNHGGQSLRRLAERGGLSACEAVAILQDRRWERMADAEAQRALAAMLTAFQAQRAAGDVREGS